MSDYSTTAEADAKYQPKGDYLTSSSLDGYIKDTDEPVNFAGDIYASTAEFSGAVIANGGNSGQWNSAYGWGNHANAGYSTESFWSAPTETTIEHDQSYSVNKLRLKSYLSCDTTFQIRTGGDLTGNVCATFYSGGGVFVGKYVKSDDIKIYDGRIESTAANGGGLFFGQDSDAAIYGNESLVPMRYNNSDSKAIYSNGMMDLGKSAYQFKNAYFSGTVNSQSTRAQRFIQDGSPVIDSRGLIDTLSTLRNATKDETTLEGLRDAIGNAVGGLIEKFEAMQAVATEEIGDE